MNKTRIAQKLVQIADCLRELEPVARVRFEAFSESPAHYRLAERDVQLVVDSAVAVNNEFIVESGGTPPATYFDTFVALRTLRLLSAGLARRLARTAGLRNRIVHQYETVNLRLLHRGLGGFVRDYREYVRILRRRAGI